MNIKIIILFCYLFVPNETYGASDITFLFLFFTMRIEEDKKKTKIVKTDFQGVRLKTVYLTVFYTVSDTTRIRTKRISLTLNERKKM